MSWSTAIPFPWLLEFLGYLVWKGSSQAPLVLRKTKSKLQWGSWPGPGKRISKMGLQGEKSKQITQRTNRPDTRKLPVCFSSHLPSVLLWPVNDFRALFTDWSNASWQKQSTPKISCCWTQDNKSLCVGANIICLKVKWSFVNSEELIMSVQSEKLHIKKKQWPVEP